MPSRDPRPKLLVIVGPTAVGKTKLSIDLAERIEGEIVSADSRLFYSGMDIGTDKPSMEERARIRHHLIDLAEPDDRWSLARFQEAAQEAILGIAARGKAPILVGGTGQYVRAVVEGWRAPRLEPDEEMREALRAWAEEIGSEGLHERLAELDPEAAKVIDHRNLRRTVRALEVILSTGRRFSEQRTKNQTPFQVLQIGLTRPREELYGRIDARVEAMFEAGFLQEVRGLLEKYPPDLPSFSAIGYRQVIQHLQGEISLEEAITQIKRLTRVFVRRQANWFKPEDEAIHWFEMRDNTLETVERLAKSFLGDQAIPGSS